MKLIRTNYPMTNTTFDSLFANPALAFGEFPRVFDRLVGSSIFQEARLPVDIYEDGDSYHVRTEIPGVKKEDVKITLQDGVLTVSFSTTERSVRLPDSAVSGDVTAKLEDGVLTVSVAKAETAKPRTIEIS